MFIMIIAITIIIIIITIIIRSSNIINYSSSNSNGNIFFLFNAEVTSLFLRLILHSPHASCLPRPAPALAQPPKSAEGFSDWRDVWYRLDEGRGCVSLETFQNRIRRTTNNDQAIPKALQVLRGASKAREGYVEYEEFRNYVSDKERRRNETKA